jgi:pimeloyl-ACP methyl ester carboxylesterase
MKLDMATDARRAPASNRRRNPRPAAAARSLEQVLAARAARATPPPGLRASVELNAGDELVWTARLDDGRMELLSGPPSDPTVRILTDPETMSAVARGARSGVEAFLDGRLRARGNLALSLRLGSILAPERKTRRWPTWGRVQAGGIGTSYLEAGTGFPVILLHGLGGTNASFLPTLWDLARDHRVIAPDMPGFGETDKPLRSYHAPFFARWVIEFMDAMGIERAHLVGNSMGGRVAIETVLVAPERVDRVALLAPSAAFLRRREFVRLVRLLRPELAVVPLPLISHGYVVRGIRSLFSRPARLPMAWYEAAADEFLRVFSSARGRIAFFSAARQIYLEEPHGDDGFWDRLPALSRPTLFLWGERDWVVPAKFARHVRAALPRAGSVVLRDCGHVPQFELPDETHRLVREFLQGA